MILKVVHLICKAFLIIIAIYIAMIINGNIMLIISLFFIVALKFYFSFAFCINYVTEADFFEYIEYYPFLGG